MLYRKIDENGLFIEDVILEEQPMIEQNEELIPDPLYITETVPQGFYHPKWDGTEWVEGLSKEEIAELTKPALQEPNLEERLEQTEQLLQATTMAFTEFIFSQAMGKQHDDN